MKSSHAAALFAALMCSSAVLAARAAETKKVSFDAPAAGNKYTQQHAIDVGDAPGHQVRVFELLRAYGKDGPEIEGARLKEAWIRGVTDFTDFNGLGTAYVMYVMDNGERIYANGHFLAHKTSAADKSAYRNLTELTVTGGTGRFLAIRGIVRAETTSDPVANFNLNHTELEYWMEK